MITRNDIGEALAMLTGNAADKTPKPSEITVLAWVDYFRQFPSWSGDDLVVSVVEYCKRPRERLVQPADLGAVIRAFHADELARMDPDDRAQQVGEPQVRRDKFGYVDRSAPDPSDPPGWHEMTSEDRLAHYWGRVNEAHDLQEYRQAIDHPQSLLMTPPATAAVRAEAIAAFAASRRPAQEPAEAVPHLNVMMVACPFCKSAAREACTVWGLPGHQREKLITMPGHPARIEAAALAAGYDEQQAREITDELCRRVANRARSGWSHADMPQLMPTPGVLNTDAARGAEVVASGEHAPTITIEAPPEAIPGGGYRDEAGQLHFPDTAALDRAWARRHDETFGH